MREEQDSRAMEEILAEYVKREANNQKEIEELKRELVWYKSHSQQMEASLAFRVGMKLSNLNRRLGGGIVLKLLRKIKHKIKGNLENNIKSTSDNAQCLSTNYDNLLPLAEFEFYKYKEERERIYHISLENIEVPCKKDLVSVVLPVYNGGDLLKESIESVLRQSYENFEFIIVDDGSTDNTAEIIDYYAKMDNRIRAIHKENEKLPKTLSRGFKEARGEFFTWTSADNIMETDFLKKLVGELKKYPELGMVYANIKLIDAKGEFITTNQWYANPKRPEQVMFPKCILRLNTYADNYIGAAFMYRASVARVIGDYSANRYCIEDYDYWMRINNIFQLRHSDFNEAIYRYRFHSDSLTAKDKELKITENRYQEMLWESFRREYLLKPICWIIDGDYQNIEIFKAFKESIVKANHKLVLAEDLDTNKESGIYEKSIYVKFDGEQRIRNSVDSIYKALVTNNDIKNNGSFDCCITIEEIPQDIFSLDDYTKWICIKNGQDLFAVLDVKAKEQFLGEMEKVSISKNKFMYKLSIILPFIGDLPYFTKCFESLCNQNIVKSEYEIIVVGEESKRNQALTEIKNVKSNGIKIKYAEASVPNIVEYYNTGFWISKGEIVNILNPIYFCKENYVAEIIDVFNLNPKGAFLYGVENGQKADSLLVKAKELFLVGGFSKLNTQNSTFLWSGWDESVTLKLEKHGRQKINSNKVMLEKLWDQKDNNRVEYLYERFANEYALQLKQLKKYDTWSEQIEKEIQKNKSLSGNIERTVALEKFKGELLQDIKERKDGERIILYYTIHPSKKKNKLEYLNIHKQKQPWVSVIVPVYKVERYLERCVESIRKQTLENLEIILVDDGSPDQCPMLCDQYAELDKRIRVIHKENGGLSDARNVGISIAQGRYISFVDSDDWIESNMYEELCFVAEQYEADIAEASFRYVYPNSIKNEFYDTGACIVLTNEDALDEEMRWGYFKSVAWNKIYRREIFKEGLRYPKGKYHEDEFLTHKLLYECKNVVYLDRVMYNYFQRSDSITGEQFNINGLDAVEAWWEKVVFYKEHDLKILYEKALEMYCWIALDRLEKCQDNNITGERVEALKRNLCKNYSELVLGNVPAEYLKVIVEMKKNVQVVC